MFEDLGIDAVKAIADINDNMISSKDAADKAKEAYEETFGAKFQGMIERIKEPLAQIGMVFLDIAEPIIILAGHFATLISTVPGLDLIAAAFIGIMVAIGPIISLIANATIAFSGLTTIFGSGGIAAGLLSTALGALSGIFTTIATFITGTLIPAIVSLVATFGLPIAIIGAVVAAGYLLIKNWDTVKEACSALGQWISTKWAELGEKTKTKWAEISQSVKKYVSDLKENASNKINDLTNSIKEKWNKVKSDAQAKWNEIISSVIAKVTELRNKISSKIEEIKGVCSRVFSQIKEILVSPFRSAKSTIDSIIGGISKGINKVTGFLGKAKTIDINSNVQTNPLNSYENEGISVFARGSITDSINGLMATMSKIDYSSSRYNSSGSNIVISNNKDNTVNELRQQNNLLSQLLNVMQNNNNDSGIHLTIENFNNNRNIDIKTLYEELEYYKYQSKLARGGV